MVIVTAHIRRRLILTCPQEKDIATERLEKNCTVVLHYKQNVRGAVTLLHFLMTRTLK